jgi:pimeloyl-ACP methyl ester carboxylesterase
VWLSDAFRSWSIETLLPTITCPVLAVQGENDEYGSLQQVFGIAQANTHTTVEVLADCGHSPHKDQAQALLDRVQRFVSENTAKCRVDKG